MGIERAKVFVTAGSGERSILPALSLCGSMLIALVLVVAFYFRYEPIPGTASRPGTVLDLETAHFILSQTLSQSIAVYCKLDYSRNIYSPPILQLWKVAHNANFQIVG
jgi:hypothetical protein